MPVPVPRISRPPAHPVIKQPRRASIDQVVPLQHLSHILPVSPTGPPPSFGTREQWINSLPTWRRTKPRRIWEDDVVPVPNAAQPDHNKMVVAADHLETGVCAKPRVSPIHILFQTRSSPPVNHDFTGLGDGDGDADDEMSSDCSVIGHARYDSDNHCGLISPSGCDYMHVGDSYNSHTAGGLSTTNLADGGRYIAPCYERGAFTPVFEEDSTTHEVVSSPLGPITPFGQFVDRAVAATKQFTCNNTYPAPISQHAECYLSQSPMQQMVVAPTVGLIPSPTATDTYRKLAEPLANWIADYVWKACTTGMSLPPAFCQSNVAVKPYPALPPSQLATSVHSLLLSTLLQPSAIFLGLWYIIRLPVFFDAAAPSVEHIKENRFRAELLGHYLDGPDRDRTQSDAPFRMIVLGFMLANKWLDDHTFSNKTWHSISNVPIQCLNKLEYLTLDIFSHDLSISCDTWTRWLAHLMSYHLSLSSSHLQPISRPSSNPFGMIRKTIEELTQAPAARSSIKSSSPEPTFLGLEERRRVKSEKEQGSSTGFIEVLEFDLDEDGPLPDEYLPKRRISVQQAVSVHAVKHLPKPIASENTLPTPAKWSPAGDEPICREGSRVGSSCLTVWPPSLDRASQPPRPQHHILQVAPLHQLLGDKFTTQKRVSDKYGYTPPSRHLEHLELAHHVYPYMLHIPAFHARSLSQSYSQDNCCMGSNSQLQPYLDYRYNECWIADEPANFDAQWGHNRQHGRPFYGPSLKLPYGGSWLRT